MQLNVIHELRSMGRDLFLDMAVILVHSTPPANQFLFLLR